jgi:hypothetical protein
MSKSRKHREIFSKEP